MEEILNLIKFKHVFIQNQIDKIFSRQLSKKDKDNISKLDLRNVNNIINIYQEIIDSINKILEKHNLSNE